MDSNTSIAIRTLCSSDGGYICNKQLTRKLSAVPSLVLSMLCSINDYANTQHTIDNDGYFYCTRNFVMESLNITRREQDDAFRKLVGARLITYKLKGAPPKRYIKINYDILASVIAADTENFDKCLKLSCMLFDLENQKPENDANKLELFELYNMYKLNCTGTLYYAKLYDMYNSICTICTTNNNINNITNNIYTLLSNIYNNIENKSINISTNTSEQSSSNVDTQPTNTPVIISSIKESKVNNNDSSNDKKCFNDLNARTRADDKKLASNNQILFSQRYKYTKNDNILISHKKKIDACNFSSDINKALYTWIESLIEAKKVINSAQLSIALDKIIKLNKELDKPKIIEIINNATLSNYVNFDWAMPKQTSYNNSGNPYASAKRTFDLPPHENNDIEELPGETRSDAVKRYKAELIAQGCKEY